MKKKCEYCGAEFEASKSTPGKRYCSTHCYDQQQKKQRRLRRLIALSESPIKLKCVHCGCEFISENRKKQYCSEKCKAEAKAERRAEPALVRECKNCGRSFNTRDAGAEFCSNRCNLEYLGVVTRVHSKNRGGQVSDFAREAAECNLDYGTYRAFRNMGKTYEELKALAPIRNPPVHQHTPIKGVAKI